MVSCNAETRILTWSTEHFCGSSCQFVFMGALVLWQLLLIDDYLSWIAPQLKVNFNFKPSSTSPCGFPIPNARPNHAPFVNFICNVERLVPQRRWFFFFLALNLKSILKKNYSLNFCEFNHLMWNICLLRSCEWKKISINEQIHRVFILEVDSIFIFIVGITLLNL